MTRSMVWLRTRLVSWSQERRVPVRVRPSAVMTRTFSVRWGEGVSFVVVLVGLGGGNLLLT